MTGFVVQGHNYDSFFQLYQIKHYGCIYGCKASMYYEKVNEPDHVCQTNTHLSTQVGIYVFQLMDHYTAIVSIMFLAFFEVIGVCWLYGVKRLSSNLEEMTGKRPNIFFRVCWWVICPVLITVILVFSVIQFKPARYENYVYPPWAQGVGWLIALASIIWIPIAAVHKFWVLPGSFTEVIYTLCFGSEMSWVIG
ncbi:sodium-dependent dopamine transporter [Labeo rohita]|uniref:sodium-dependent dopamine transporter n=1 Tax=Labeo rohita TaxID=84645 RepID=UPI0021E25DF3|nr:sodium-dependent dopamine transporter [Labeo rohita]